MAAEHSPVEQFLVKPVFGDGYGIGVMTFTNSALFMVIAVLLITALMVMGMRGRAMVPGRWQSMAEVLYEFVAKMLKDNVGDEGRPYFPFIFSLFTFVLLGNVLGMIPYSFTYTSHIVVTATLAMVVFVGVTIIGFMRHGTHFFRLFFPKGAPIATAPLLIPIELISYLSRPFSLSVRLAANMTVGHIMLKVLAGFVVALGMFGILPLVFLMGISVLEFGIALLQAYVFAVLSCIYLHDAIHMH